MANKGQLFSEPLFPVTQRDMESCINRYVAQCVDFHLENLRVARHLVNVGILQSDFSSLWNTEFPSAYLSK